MDNLRRSETGGGSQAGYADDGFVDALSGVYRQLRYGNNLKKSMRQVEQDLLSLMDARLFTIYQSVSNGREVIASFKSGINGGDDDIEIRVPFTPTSLAGYVALSQRPLLVADVYDGEELATIHPRLQWDRRFSESRGMYFRSMIVVPIKDEVLLGVLQLIRLRDDPAFTREDLKNAMRIAQMLARQFRSEFQSTQGPYDYLVQQKRISSNELEEVQKSATLYGGSVTRMLMDDFSIDADEIGRSLEYYYRVPYMAYDPELVLPDELLDNLGKSYLRNNLWVPVSGNRDEVVILISDPSNHQRIMEIQGVLNARNYVFRVGLPEHILEYLGSRDEEAENDFAGFDEVFRNLERESPGDLEELEGAEQEDASLAPSSAIIQLVNRIIIEAERLGSSDIHIEPGREREPGTVRVRVDGICRELLRIPAEHTAALLARIKVMARLDISERRLPQDGKCKLRIRQRSLELRVATVPTIHGESAVLRIFSAGSAIPLEQLNLAPRIHDRLVTLAGYPHGLILVVGPTGSGKTTTLHALLAHLNQPDRKIWTAEDPVEITQPGLQQVQVQPKIGFTFVAAMRAFLRADPDVILIGEMRDQETAAIGIEASLTGHLVLSTLHTNSAPETITRLLDLGLDPVNFSDALLGILAQRLMRTLCSKCKEAYRPDEKELDHLIDQYGREQFGELGIDPDHLELMQAVGCEACGGTGYRGRIGVHELLEGTHEMQNLIYRQAELDSIREQAQRDGMRTLKQDAIHKILQGLSDYEQLLRVVAE